jgi:DNA topoisomerase II
MASLEEKYKKENLQNHIYNTPDTYVGGCDLICEKLCIYDSSQDKIIEKEIEYIPALFNIYNEILVNAKDQVTRLNGLHSKDKSVNIVTEIKVEINPEKGEISIMNNGDGIDVAEHPKEKKNGKPIYIPQLIFGELLTSTNYNKDEQKVVGGKNGYGAKLTNIFSKSFKLETVDSKRKKKYSQLFRSNMKVIQKPKISDYSGKPYTKITWTADFKRFGIENYSEDMINLMIRRVYDISGITDKSVSVYLNKKKLTIKSFSDYSKMHLLNDEIIIYDEFIDNNIPWKIGVSISNTDSFEQVSFVNGICTPKGGKHVDLVSKILTSGLKKQLTKKCKRDINETYIKNYLRIFIDTLIVNPSFDSQTKERLITTASKFGSKPEISDKFIKNIIDKTDILDRVVQFSEFKLNKQSKKTDGQKKNKIRDIPKLDDANWAGTRKSEQCILILTEGDSAKSMAISGLSVVGRDIYGAFPLKGKVMNVRDASIDQIMKNSEITNLKKILGLVNGKVYTDTKSLRYGKIMIMTDQDHDGSHIKGLVMNVFHHMWSSLLELGFITSMITPIVKVSHKKKIKSFYTLTEYNEWLKKNNSKSWKTKYYKGLGTSSASEAKEYFSNMKLNNYIYNDDTNEKMNLAFSKDRSDSRKEWLYQFDEENILDHKKTEISIPDFIDKELIHFSNSDTLRSIGSLYDGLKPSQRKILYSCFKRKLYNEIRVAQLAGYVSENAAYHHGEASLQGAIIGMAQDYLGSNNINLLMPNGQFGTRIMGGHDSASPRYIHTELNKIVDLIYPSLDFKMLEYNDDDGILVEPKYYVPIIPMVLVNGMNGIGTGFSTSIPKHDPIDIIKNMKRKIKDEKYGSISPYYRGFIGKILKIDKKNYISKGKYEIIDDCNLRITELPIGKWTDDYKKFLDSLILDTSSKSKKSLENEKHKKKSQPKKTIIDYVNNSSDRDIDFKITFEKGFLNSLQWDEDENIDGIEKFFKLTTSKGLSYNNIHLYNDKNQIQKYDNIYDIFDEFYKIRYELYVKRKEYLLNELNNELLILKSKMRFITDVMNEKIKIYKRKRIDIINDLLKEKYLMVNDGKTLDFKSDIKPEDIKYYDYLIKMSIYLFTEDEIEKLTDKINKLSEEYDKLDKMKIEEIWLSELDKLLDILD